MKAELLSIAEYIESLERRIAALEAATAMQTAHIAAQEERLPASESRPAECRAEEPEEESALVIEDEPEPVVEESSELIEEAAPEPVVEDVPEQTVEETPEPIVEDTPEPVKEEPAAPATHPDPVQHAPQQTSLFGAPVSDIRQAISIGDRFLFQRELFGGNGEMMQKMLDRLNSCASLGEAMDMVAQQPWDKESPTYELFTNVLRRRFQ